MKLRKVAGRYKYQASCRYSIGTDRKAKSPSDEAWAKCLFYLGWLMGLEPTTTGITILDSTN